MHWERDLKIKIKSFMSTLSCFFFLFLFLSFSFFSLEGGDSLIWFKIHAEGSTEKMDKWTIFRGLDKCVKRSEVTVDGTVEINPNFCCYSN